MFLICCFGVHARGVQTPNVMISVLIFFGGVGQYLVGIMEFVSGNTFGATVFTSYGAFNLSYSLIYLPGSGIIAAYTDPETGALSPEFAQSISLYLWAWFILTVVYTIAAVRSSWVLLLDLAVLDVSLLLLAVGYMVGSQSVLTAGYSFGFLVSFLSCKSLSLFRSTQSTRFLTRHRFSPDWAGCAGLYAGGTTPFTVPVFPLTKED